jgi:hypothetical protein
MSVAFASARPRGKGEVTQQTIQKVGRARDWCGSWECGRALGVNKAGAQPGGPNPDDPKRRARGARRRTSPTSSGTWPGCRGGACPRVHRRCPQSASQGGGAGRSGPSAPRSRSRTRTPGSSRSADSLGGGGGDGSSPLRSTWRVEKGGAGGLGARGGGDGGSAALVRCRRCRHKGTHRKCGCHCGSPQPCPRVLHRADLQPVRPRPSSDQLASARRPDQPEGTDSPPYCL